MTSNAEINVTNKTFLRKLTTPSRTLPRQLLTRRMVDSFKQSPRDIVTAAEEYSRMQLLLPQQPLLLLPPAAAAAPAAAAPATAAAAAPLLLLLPHQP